MTSSPKLARHRAGRASFSSTGCRPQSKMANDPVLIAYVVRDRPGKKPRWLRIGVTFPHDRGSGLTVVLNALPLHFDGRIVLVEPKIDPSKFPPVIPPPADES